MQIIIIHQIDQHMAIYVMNWNLTRVIRFFVGIGKLKEVHSFFCFGGGGGVLTHTYVPMFQQMLKFSKIMTVFKMTKSKHREFSYKK